MASPDIMIYWGSGSPPCWRVLIVLKEKGLAYNEKILNFSKKEHKSEEVLALNPRGQMPTTVIDKIVVNESMAACDYLESIYGGQGNRLVPQGPENMALVLQRKFEAVGFTTACSALFMPLMFKMGDTSQENIDNKKTALMNELQLWEGYIEKVGENGHIGGKDFSMADVIFFPHLAFLVRMGMPLGNKFPKLKAYYDQVAERPSIKSSWPPHWAESDSPGVLKDFC